MAWLISLPRGATLFPLIVGKLLKIGAVRSHDKDLAVRLWRSGIYRLVLEPHSAAGEHDPLPIRGPGQMGVITACIGQLSDIGAIGPDREYANVGTVLTDECNQIATWRPD